MAYITKAEIQEKRKQINALCKQHGVSATVSGANTSSVTVTIRKGKIDFLVNHVETVRHYERVKQNQIVDNAEWYAKRGYFTCNHYYLDRQFSGDALAFLNEVLTILKIGHYDNSDIMTDYFNCAWYMHICIGTYEKPYQLISK